MRVQSINPSFTGRININKLKDIKNSSILRNSAESGLTGSAASAVTGSVALDAAISGSQLTGTAFVSKASGLNSSGIAPFVMEMVEPFVTPAVIAASQKYPSVVGTLSTTSGDLLLPAKTVLNKSVKIPS